MTLDQLLNAPASELEKITDKQLIEFFSPYFNVTRPENIIEVTKTSRKPMTYEEIEKDKRLKRGQMLLDTFGKKLGLK